MVSGHASPAAIYTAIWTTTLLAILAVALRIFTTAVIVRQLKCDDYLILGSLGFVIVFTGMVTLESELVCRVLSRGWYRGMGMRG